MGTILSYLAWRGDLTFAERPFCNVDNLALSILTYLDFREIVPKAEDGGSVSLKDAAARYLEKKGREDGLYHDFITKMAESRRFGALPLSNYVSILDRDSGTDFCALHIGLGDQIYVAFRGTSDSLIGWREDFSMSFQLMPSQRLAAEYLEKTIVNTEKRYLVGGHSKGGNLAVYGAMALSAEKQALIDKIYSNDGPGLCPDIIDTQNYSVIVPKLVRIVPEFSVIGALFETEEPQEIVRSSASGFTQHSAMTWQIEGDNFIPAPGRSPEAEYYNRIFDQWIESATVEQRKSFTKDFFDALEAGGSKKRTDILHSGFDGFEAILLSMIHSERRSKIVIGKFLRSFFSAFGSAQFSALFREKEALQGLALFAIGLFLAVAPEFSAQCIGGGLGLAGVVYLGKRQIDCALSPETENRRQKLIFHMVLMCAMMYLIAQRSLLLHFSNLLMGGVFLFFSYRWARTMFQRELPGKTRAFSALFGAVAFVLGIVPIVTAGLVMWQYVLSAGILILLFGVGKILHGMYVESNTPPRQARLDGQGGS